MMWFVNACEWFYRALCCEFDKGREVDDELDNVIVELPLDSIEMGQEVNSSLNSSEQIDARGAASAAVHPSGHDVELGEQMNQGAQRSQGSLLMREINESDMSLYDTYLKVTNSPKYLSLRSGLYRVTGYPDCGFEGKRGWVNIEILKPAKKDLSLGELRSRMALHQSLMHASPTGNVDDMFWKLHVSIDDFQDDQNFTNGVKALFSVLEQSKVTRFKIIHNHCRELIRYDEAQCGKHVTLYSYNEDRSIESWTEIIQKASKAMSNNAVRPGPIPLVNYPGSNMHAKYEKTINGTPFFTFRPSFNLARQAQDHLFKQAEITGVDASLVRSELPRSDTFVDDVSSESDSELDVSIDDFSGDEYYCPPIIGRR